MTRFEALDLLIELRDLLEANKYGEAMQRIGMEDSLFDQEASLNELMQVFQVRYMDLARYVGIDISELDGDEEDE